MTTLERRWTAAFVIVTSSYVAAQMLADITSLRIVMILGFSVDAGTLIYPITFTLRDLVHKIAGVRAARVAIGTAAVVNLFMAGLFWVASHLAPDLAIGEQLAFGEVLAPVWRIVFASIIAEVIAELIDGQVYEAWVRRFGSRHQWGRVLSSNSVAVPIDSALFVLIAFGGTMPASVAMSIFWANVLIKGATSIASLPLIYTVTPAASRLSQE